MSITEDDSRQGYRILVTGGSGFIGTHLTDFYQGKGAEILNLDPNPPLNPDQKTFWREHDILDAEATFDVFRAFQPTHVIHLAARADLDEKRDVNAYDVNIQGVRNVLNGIQQVDSVERVVVASTMFVCVPGYTPKAEDDYCPHTVYGESKVLTEKITREHGLTCVWTIVRPAMIWGPYHERLRDEFFTILRKGLYFHPGNTRARRSYGYVGNTVFQIDGILNAQPDQVNKRVLYLSDPPVSLFDWADELSRKLIGKPVRKIPLVLMKTLAMCGDGLAAVGWKGFPMSSFRLDNMTRDNLVDTDAINSVVWPLPYSLSDSIDETVKWLNKQ